MHPRNREFIALLKASGWSQAAIARRLEVTPGVVSQWKDGATVPRPIHLKYLKELLAREIPYSIGPCESGSDPIDAATDPDSTAAKLAVLKRESPQTYESIRHLIEESHSQVEMGHSRQKTLKNQPKGQKRHAMSFLKTPQPDGGDPVSSDEAAELAKLVDAAEAIVDADLAQERERKSKADATSGQKERPSSGASPASKARPASPKRAPK